MLFLVINAGFEGGYIAKKIHNPKDTHKEHRYISVCSGHSDVWDPGECSEAALFPRHTSPVWIWFTADNACHLLPVDLLGYRNLCCQRCLGPHVVS